MATTDGAPQSPDGTAVASSSGTSDSGASSPGGGGADGASAGGGSAGGGSAGGGKSGAGAGASPSVSITIPKWKGRRVKRFKLVDELGEGAMGRVFLAEDTVLKRHVALKILPAKHRDGRPNHRTERLIREARSCASLDHPGMVSVYEIDEAGGIHYIAMELVEGGNLEKLVQMSGPMETERACQLIAEAAEALSHAHSRGIIHRDIKPANLLLTRSGRCKVADFGLAAWDDADDAEQRQRCVGTPYFIAPEVAAGKGATAASDIYSLGCTLWFLLSGRQPYAGTSAREVMKQHISAPLPELRRWRPDVPARLSAAIEQACAKDPIKRFDSADRFAKVLRTFTIPTASGSGSGSYVPPPLAETTPGGSGGDGAYGGGSYGGGGSHGGSGSQGGMSGQLPPISAAQLEAIMQAAAPAVAAAAATNPRPRPAVHPGLMWGGGGLVVAAVLIAFGVWLTRPGNDDLLAPGAPARSATPGAVASGVTASGVTPAVAPAGAGDDDKEKSAPIARGSATAENALNNGTIEAGAEGEGKVAGWFIAERCRPQVWTKTEGLNKYMRLISIDATNTVHVDQKIELEADWKSVTVSARIRAAGFVVGKKGSSGVTIGFYDEKDKTVGGHQPALAVKQDGPWDEKDVTVKVPAGAKKLYLQCVVSYTKGTMDFDDVKVVGLK
ncbi:MAG: serine/threonine-protein kinase [Tepidisphaeraceae bacterium]